MAHMQNNQREKYTVSQLNRKAKGLLETHLKQIWVEGEISNFSRPASGHWYFTLKDDNAQIRCAIFRNRNSLLKTTPKAGDQYLVRARVSLYEPRGDYQLIAEHMEPAGEGLLQQQFEQLKQRLANEGLFDAQHKKAIPSQVQKLGIISSPTGAAVHDILHVLARRNPSIEVVIIPATVQGNDAPAQLSMALAKAEAMADLDVIILGRGGGSLEDLRGFNDEALARSIFYCPIPIISAVGHEIDFSISDFVADVRAPTPSAAAELASSDNRAEIQQLHTLARRLYPAFSRYWQQRQNYTVQLSKRLRHPGERINQWQQRTDICEMRLREKITSVFKQHKQSVQHSKELLLRIAPDKNLNAQRNHLVQLHKRMHAGLNSTLETKQGRLSKSAAQLDIISPLATLRRGYVISKNDRGKLIKSAKDCKPDSEIKLTFHDGDVAAKIMESPQMDN